MPISPVTACVKCISINVGTASMVAAVVASPSGPARRMCLDSALSCAVMSVGCSLLNRCIANTPEDKDVSCRQLKSSAFSLFCIGGFWFLNHVLSADMPLENRDVNHA